MSEPLVFGSTIGILGGGQLGRMLALAAAPLGFHCHIYCPDEKSPAALVSERWTRAAYDDEAALAAFAHSVDVITYEFENVPVETIRFLEILKPVRPGTEPLRIAQDRLLEKDYLNAQGIATAPYRPVESLADLENGLRELGHPAVLKTRRFGYDGKGQRMIRAMTEAAPAFEALGGKNLILEGFVDFRMEVSAIAARGLDGALAVWPVSENSHKNHILDETIVPARIPPEVEKVAREAAAALSAALDYCGVLALELFVTGKGIVANEFAPRVHNSGHWSIEGARTSQFENHIRAICGLPLGSTQLLGDVRMRNLIGDDVHDWVKFLDDPEAHLHLYGKREARRGRKMGHVTWVKGPRF